MIDFKGARITSDTGFPLLREVDEPFGIVGPINDCLEDLRSPAHTKHVLVQMVRQRVYRYLPFMKIHVASGFPLSHHYRAVLGWNP